MKKRPTDDVILDLWDYTKRQLRKQNRQDYLMIRKTNGGIKLGEYTLIYNASNEDYTVYKNNNQLISNIRSYELAVLILNFLYKSYVGPLHAALSLRDKLSLNLNNKDVIVFELDKSIKKRDWDRAMTLDTKLTNIDASIDDINAQAHTMYINYIL